MLSDSKLASEEKLPGWFWVAMMYLAATVAYNLWINRTAFTFGIGTYQVELAANLLCKICAVVLLFYRRGEGVYLLAAAFFIGLGGTLWDALQQAYGFHLPILQQVSRVNGFLISFAIIVYMAILQRRGVLSGRSRDRVVADRLRAFD